MRSFLSGLGVLAIGLIIGTFVGVGQRPAAPAIPAAAAGTAPALKELSAPALAAPAFVIESHSWVEVRNYVYVTGEATNMSVQPARLSVVATFYDGAGAVVGTDSSHLNDSTRLVPPGETVPFEIMHPKAQSGSKYRLQVERTTP